MQKWKQAFANWSLNFKERNPKPKEPEYVY